MPVNTWEKLGTASVSAASVANTSWKELDRVTLGSSGDTLDTGTFTAKDNIMVLCHTISTGGAAGVNQLTFNNDTGSNYAYRGSQNGGSDTTSTSQANINMTSGPWNNSIFSVADIVNISSQEKLMISHSTQNESTSAANVPRRHELIGKWANTSNQITRVIGTNTGAGSFDTGSEIVVLGYDNDEADSGTNFWQELASVELSSAGDTINSGTFTAKKYLMFEFFNIASGSAGANIRFNSDTGSNYARREGKNGGADSIVTSQTLIETRAVYGNSSGVGYIINKSDKEKLLIFHENDVGSSGAGTAPQRNEVVGKWANTSAQISSIQIYNDGSGDFDTGSYLKVYGAD